MYLEIYTFFIILYLCGITLTNSYIYFSDSMCPLFIKFLLSHVFIYNRLEVITRRLYLNLITLYCVLWQFIIYTVARIFNEIIKGFFMEFLYTHVCVNTYLCLFCNIFCIKDKIDFYESCNFYPAEDSNKIFGIIFILFIILWDCSYSYVIGFL